MSKADGQKIAIKFTQPILSDLSTLSLSSFAITGSEYDMTPEGTLQAKNYPVGSVSKYNSVDTDIALSTGALTNLVRGSDIRLIQDPGEGYLTFNGGNYATLPSVDGLFPGPFILQFAFYSSSFPAYKTIISKINPSSGSGVPAGYQIKTNNTSKLMIEFSASGGSSTGIVGITTLVVNTNYLARFVFDGTTLVVYLSTDNGVNWITDITTTDSTLIAELQKDTGYLVNLGRSRYNRAWTDYWPGRIGRIWAIKGGTDPTATKTYDFRMSVTGTNPVLPDAMGGASGQSYSSVTGTQTISPFYLPSSGSVLFSTTVVQAITNVGESAISWTATAPTNTTLHVYAACGDSLPEEEDYLECTSGGAIPGISAHDDLSTSTLYLKVTIATTDTTVTPTLSALHITLTDSAYDKVILLTMSNTDNGFRNVNGDLTVTYDSSLGNLAGEGGPVPSFSKTFTPSDLVAKPDIHEPIHMEIVNVTTTVNFIRIYYSYAQDNGSENHLEVSDAWATCALIHINDI